MALEFSSSSTLLSRLGSDHQAHMRSISRALAGAIATKLNERTGVIDGRSGARASVSGVKASKTASGSTGYAITITQRILPDVQEDKRRKILLQQGAVKNQLANKNGVLALLGSAGVH